MGGRWVHFAAGVGRFTYNCVRNSDPGRVTMGRPGFDESAPGSGGDDETDAELVGYVQESEDGMGFLTASADEGDTYTADGGREQRKR